MLIFLTTKNMDQIKCARIKTSIIISKVNLLFIFNYPISIIKNMSYHSLTFNNIIPY